MTPEVLSGRWPNAHRVLLIALAEMLVARMPYVSTHMDLARDMFIAWRTIHGIEFPLNGPVLAGAIHLGPVWYWLLALLLFVAGSWLGTLVLLGLLAATQIPLAYLLGKEVHSRPAGVMIAIGLVGPTWSSLEWTYPLHFLLTTPLVLGFALCTVRYLRSAQTRYLVGLAALFVLALHAHPTNIGLVWIVLGTLVYAWRDRSLRWQALLLAGAVALLPLLPYFVWDAQHGFADLRAGLGYLGDADKTGSLANVVPLLDATVRGGTFYWFGALLQWSPLAAGLATSVLLSCGVLGASGLILAMRNASDRKWLLAAIAAAAAVLVSTALIRSHTPYYMTTPLHVLLTALTGIGLAQLGIARWARAVRVATGVFVIGGALVCGYAGARLQMRGDWPFSFVPLFGVTDAASPTSPLLLQPAYALRTGGRFLCDQKAPTAHGALASNLLHDYAIEMRLVCGRNDVQLGGNDASRQHFLGLSRSMFAQIQVRPAERLGPMGLVAARSVNAEAKALAPPDEPRYPVYLPALATSAEHVLRFRLASGEHLAVSNIAFALAPDPVLNLTFAGRKIDPLASDRVSTIFTCSGCAASDGGSEVELSVQTSDLPDVDVVIF